LRHPVSAIQLSAPSSTSTVVHPSAPSSTSVVVQPSAPSSTSTAAPLPLPCHLSTDLSRHFPHALPVSHLRVARAANSSIPIGSYNSAEFLSPTATMNFSEETLSPRWVVGVVLENSLPRCQLEDEGANVEIQKEQRAVSGKLLKKKTMKAERRAMQGAHRAAKAASKGEGSKTSVATGVNAANANTGKLVKAISQRKDNFLVAASEKKSGDSQTNKDRKKDVPHPRMQFHDANRVEKAKKQFVVQHLTCSGSDHSPPFITSKERMKSGPSGSSIRIFKILLPQIRKPQFRQLD
ncbi:hypothetical protein Pfo_011531, partial [Paulownia fortunei]